MPALQNGIYKIKTCIPQAGHHQLFIGIDTKHHREQRSGHIKEGTPIILVQKQKAVKIEVEHKGGDNYRLCFISHEASGMNFGCDKHNLQKNNKVFVTKEEVEWAIDQGNYDKSYHVQVRESGMYMTVPQEGRENTQLKLAELMGQQGQEWEFERIEKQD